MPSDKPALVKLSRREIEDRVAQLDRTIADTDRYLTELRRERIDLKMLLTDTPPGYAAMPSAPTPRERAIRALYCILADVEPAVMEAIESAIVAAVAVERKRCADIVRKRHLDEHATVMLQEIENGT